MARQPKPRFTLDEKSMRGAHNDVHVRHFRILYDGRDHGLRGQTGWLEPGWVQVGTRRLLVDGMFAGAIVAWMNQHLTEADLPPLRTEQLELEI